MKPRLPIVLLYAVLFSTVVAGSNASPDASGGATAQPLFGTWGFDAAGSDPATKPGDDFFRYANGHWLVTTEIPACRAPAARSCRPVARFHRLRKLRDRPQPTTRSPMLTVPGSITSP